jgi:hypothetical protein
MVEENKAKTWWILNYYSGKENTNELVVFNYCTYNIGLEDENIIA